MKQNYKIISIGGSIIIPKTGFDIEFLKKFRKLIVDEIKQGGRFILVVGGGATCRQYQNALKAVIPMTSEQLDWLGIYSTQFNARFVQMMFSGIAHLEIITDPTKKIKTTKSLIIGAGWKPGCSTDTDAVYLARTYGAKEIVNFTNIDYVYDKDPRTHADAQKLEHISWKEMRKIVGDTWSPGTNAPFDPIASKLAEKLGLKVFFAEGTDLGEVKKVLQGKKFKGTIIG
jgi:uridylate kinase